MCKGRRRRWLPTTQIRLAVPFMLQAAHQEGAIESNRALGEQRLIVEETRAHFLNVQRLNMPGWTVQLQPMEASRIGRRGVAEPTGLKERGRCVQRAKDAGGGKLPCQMDADGH